jgi:hypothetical protein
MRKEDFVVGKIYSTDMNNSRYYYVGPNPIMPNQGIFQGFDSCITHSFLYESSAYEWKEGTYIALSYLPYFLAKMIAGPLSGWLLATYTPEGASSYPDQYMIGILIGRDFRKIK